VDDGIWHQVGISVAVGNRCSNLIIAAVVALACRGRCCWYRWNSEAAGVVHKPSSTSRHSWSRAVDSSGVNRPRSNFGTRTALVVCWEWSGLSASSLLFCAWWTEVKD
jgi:hypothetical protein